MFRRAYTSTRSRKMRRKAFDRQEWFSRRRTFPLVQSMACVSLRSMRQSLQLARARLRAVRIETISPVTSPIFARRGIVAAANTPVPSIGLGADLTGYLIMIGSQRHFAQIFRCVLGRRWIDIEARSPF